MIAATDYMRTFADQIRASCRGATGCSAPTASAARTIAASLRHFFEVDRHYVAVAALEGAGRRTARCRPAKVAEAIKKYEHRPETGAVTLAAPDASRPGGTMRRRTMAATEVKVPDIGDFKDVPVIEMLVKPGDAVKADDPLVALESDKATMEVPAPSPARSRRSWSRSATR